MARVLVVEDDVSLRRLLRRLLEGWGHLVHECEGAAQALQALDEPDSILLVDFPLGGRALDANEASARMELARATGAERVVYMTSLPVAPVRGAGFVMKPFGSSELHSQLERAVRRLGGRK